jgi:endonuclease YncB( thermonuclease family)
MKSSTWVSCLVLTGVLTIGIAAALFSVAQAAPWITIASVQTGKVTYVADGDSLYVGKLAIRLAAIDAPEHDQPYGQQARQALLNLILGRVVRIESVATDDYGRTVAHIYRVDDGLHVNAAMVEQGAAWVYRRYTRDQSFMALENTAKRDKKGLWALPGDQRISPEQWRRKHETVRGAFDCAVRKTRCKQMGSCEEARFYLTRCHSHWLDGDKDGVPCEKLCRRR